MAQACNPSTLGGRGRWIMRSRDQDHPGQHDETPSLLKIQKISWAQWCMPVIPATQEAEAGKLPEPRRLRLRWAEIAPLHSSLGNKSKTPSQKKRNEQSLQEIWDYVKRPTLRLIDVPECDGDNESKLENTLQDIIQENFPNLARQANIQVQEIKRTP